MITLNIYHSIEHELYNLKQINFLHFSMFSILQRTSLQYSYVHVYVLQLKLEYKLSGVHSQAITSESDP